MTRSGHYLAAAVLIICTAGCDESLTDFAGPTPNLEPTFSSIQQNIFNTTDSAGRSACITCHNTTNVAISGGLNLTGAGAYNALVNAASVGQGLFPGLGLADARAICPHLLTLSAAPNKDQQALLDLARWASCRYSPTLNADGDDGLWLEVSGVPHLFGGERALLADLARRLSRLGFTARLALAETLGGAHALARYARAPVIVPAGEIEPALLVEDREVRVPGADRAERRDVAEARRNGGTDAHGPR